MLRVIVGGFLRNDPEYRAQYDDVCATVLVRNGASASALRISVHARGAAKDALLPLRAGDLVTVMGDARVFEEAGLPPPRCERFCVHLAADMVFAGELTAERSSASKRFL